MPDIEYQSCTDLWTVCATTSGAEHFPISDVDINLSLIDLNYAVILTSDYFAPKTELRVCYNKSKPVFAGKVTQCKKLSFNPASTKSQYEVEIVEIAEELKYNYLVRNGLRDIFIVSNNTIREQLHFYVAKVLDGTLWKDVSNENYKHKVLVHETNALPGIGFTNSTIYDALTRMVIDNCKYGLWFDYGTEIVGDITRKVRYGEYNTDIGLDWPIPADIRLLQSDINHDINGIIVYGDNPEMKVTKGNVTTTDKVICYKFTGCSSISELGQVAAEIFLDRNVVKSRYEIDFPAGWYDIREGDILTVGASAIGMTQGVWGIKDVKITMDKTVAGIGANKVTIFDIYDEQLSVIAGSLIPNYNICNIDTGFIGVGGSTSDFSIVKVPFYIPEKTFIGDMILYCEVGSATGAFTQGKQTFIMTGALSSLELSGGSDSGPGTTIAASGATGYTYYTDIYGSTGYGSMSSATTSQYLVGPTYNFEFPLSENWFPWTWDSAELKVEYTFAATTNIGTQAIWTAQWAYPDTALWTKDATTGPSAYIPMIIDTDFKVISNTTRSLVHTWYMNEQYEIPYMYEGATRYPIISVNHGAVQSYPIGVSAQPGSVAASTAFSTDNTFLTYNATTYLEDILATLTINYSSYTSGKDIAFTATSDYDAKISLQLDGLGFTQPIFNSTWFPLCYLGATNEFIECVGGTHMDFIRQISASHSLDAPYHISDVYDVNLTSFASGAHFFTLTNSGTQDIAVKVYGKYLAYDVDAFIIRREATLS